MAQALGGGDAAGAATLAAEAMQALPEDWQGRKAVVLLQVLAGKDGKAEAKALAERKESFSTRRFDELWPADDA